MDNTNTNFLANWCDHCGPPCTIILGGMQETDGVYRGERLSHTHYDYITFDKKSFQNLYNEWFFHTE